MSLLADSIWVGALKGKTVLVVEDATAIALDLESVLREMRVAEVLLAARVSEAMALLRRVRPDAAILDINLHGEMVFPVAEKLDDLQHVPFVFLTGHVGIEIPRRWLHRLILKPYHPTDLANLLCRLIDLNRADDRKGAETRSIRS
jgi:two-component SAPR family response regulator